MKEQEKPISFSMGDPFVHGKYKIHSAIGQGSSAKLYTIVFEKNLAVINRVLKMEKEKTKNPQLPTQISVLRSIFKKKGDKILHEVGFPKIYESGNQNQLNYLIMDMYGPNLAQLMKLCGGKFTMKTTLLIGLQIIDRLEVLHNENYLYLDLKPQNFLTGLGKESAFIIMVDFGKCILYRVKNKHVPYKNFAYNFDPMFSSINSHIGIHPSRRDDIEAFVYMLVFMFRGKLPWRKAEGKSRKQRDSEIYELKRKITTESLIKEMPIQLCDILEYSKSLNYFQKPDYNFLRKKLYSALETIVDSNFNPYLIEYDWLVRDDVDYQLYREVPGIKLVKQQESQCEMSSRNENISDSALKEDDGEEEENINIA